MAPKGEGSRISLAGQSIALENRSSKGGRNTVLTPSLAKIADKDVVVELRGLSQAPFRVGGKLGNVVTSSSTSQVHRGWRVVGVNGQRLGAEEVSKALASAQKMAKYTATFRLEEDGKGADAENVELERERLERERLESQRLERQKELEQLEKLRREEEERLAKAREEEERQAQLREEEERLAKAREERKKEDARKARQVVEKSLEQSAGLPPRDQIEEPQLALLAALAPAAAPQPLQKSTGPCDKCDGPHGTDECPHFKRPRDDHKDAYENYQKTGSVKMAQEVVKFEWSSVRVLPQPGDGSCLFHSLNHGLKGSGAAALRAELADFIAANPSQEVAGNPVSDWVLWDSGEDPQSYARSMREGSRWGGAMEIALCAQLRKACIEIFERRADHFVRIASFGDGMQPIRLLYGGRVHYDALEVRT